MIEVSTLAALKAANTADLGAHLTDPSLNGIFTWTLGNFSGQDDEVNVVKANSTPLTTGAWLRQSSDSTTFLQSGTGAKLRSAQDKASEVKSVRDFGAIGDGVTDDTAAFIAAFAAHDAVKVPRGTYLVSQLVLGDGKQLLTDGMATKFVQKPGSPGAMIAVTGSNVTVGDFQSAGTIATDTGEQHHAIRVYSATSSIENVQIGNIRATDIRGDALYVGAGTGNTTMGVRFGIITGANVYRSVVSIVGACQVVGDGAISDGATGYSAFNIEPDAGRSSDIVIGFVRGAVVQIAPPNAADALHNIQIGTLDLDPAYASNSTPPYPQYNTSVAIQLRNLNGINIGQVKANGHSRLLIDYVFNTGEVRGVISIGEIIASNIGESERTYSTLIKAGGIKYISIGYVSGVPSHLGQAIVVGSSDSNPTKVVINGGEWPGQVVRYAGPGSVITGVTVPSPANIETAFVQCTGAKFVGCTVNSATLISYSDGCTFDTCKANCTTYLGSSTTGTVRINSAFGGALVPFALQPVTVSSLPSAALIGDGAEHVVTDASVTTFGTVVSGGGANVVPVKTLGGNWKIS